MEDEFEGRDDLRHRLQALGEQPVERELAGRVLQRATGRGQSWWQSTKLKVAAAAAGGFLIGSVGLASAGSLPAPAQDAARSALSTVGINVPPGHDRYNDPTKCPGGPYANHGAYVRAHRNDPNAGASPCGKPNKAVNQGGNGATPGTPGAPDDNSNGNGGRHGPPPWAHGNKGNKGNKGADDQGDDNESPPASTAPAAHGNTDHHRATCHDNHYRSDDNDGTAHDRRTRDDDHNRSVTAFEMRLPLGASRVTQPAEAVRTVEDVFVALAPAVLGYLRTAGASDSENVLGDVFVRITRGLGRFHGTDADLRRWVFTIAYHCLVDEQRREQRQRLLLRRRSAPPAATSPSEPFDPTLADALARLTPDQREVVTLRFVADLSLEVVAELTQRPVGAVKSLQHRGLRNLAVLVPPPEDQRR